jgi:hypothetical protein
MPHTVVEDLPRLGGVLLDDKNLQSIPFMFATG